MLTAPDIEPLAITTAKRLRKIRVAKGMSQSDLAPLMNTTVQTVSRLEKAEMTLSVLWIEKFCTALDIAPSALFDDAKFKRQVEQDAICSKVLKLQFELQRTTTSVAGSLKAHGWPS